MLGTVVGDTAIRNLSYSGIYLVGNLPKSLTKYILDNKSNGPFMKDYVEKRGYVKTIYDRVPVYIVQRDDIGFLGAFVVTQLILQYEF